MKIKNPEALIVFDKLKALAKLPFHPIRETQILKLKAALVILNR